MKKILSILLTILITSILIIGCRKFLEHPTECLPCSELREPESIAIALINDYRQNNELEPLEWDFTLYYTALTKATKIYYGELPWDHGNYKEEIGQYYTSYSMIGELLGRYLTNETDLFLAWRESPTHNRLLLSKMACEYGLANYQDIYVLHLGCKNIFNR